MVQGPSLVHGGSSHEIDLYGRPWRRTQGPDLLAAFFTVDRRLGVDHVNDHITALVDPLARR
jgi:hypothetical protein